jgi:hypothetical protein
MQRFQALNASGLVISVAISRDSLHVRQNA